MFSPQDMTRLTDIVARAALAEIMPRFRKLGHGMVREKSSKLDLVTDADEAAEAHMQQALATAFPGALCVGEEACETNPSLLHQIADAELAIIIDPLDGTTNFAWGLPLFGSIAAVTRRGETIAGLIYDPVGGDMTLAMKGDGAWQVRASGERQRLAVSQPKALNEMIGNASWAMLPEPMRSRVAANLAKLRANYTYRCAAYEYRLLAQGLFDFSLYYKLMPWDHAAGLLIHAEAGGFAARFDGSPYHPGLSQGGIIAAPSEALWHELRTALLEA